jgi:phage terminase large subunit-like protein
VLTVTAGNVTDETVLFDTVVKDARQFGCHSIAIDRLFQAMRLSQDLAAQGLAVYPCGMGHLSLAPLVNEVERRLLAKRFITAAIRSCARPSTRSRWMSTPQATESPLAPIARKKLMR